MQGKKVVKSIQERLMLIKDHIFNEMLSASPALQGKINQAKNENSQKFS